MADIEQLQYPIGKVKTPEVITDEKLQEYITILELLPERLEELTRNLNNAQLDTAYREGGWTVRQVIHHMADSHHHSYIRFKWALTEDNPTIKPYLQGKWAELKHLEGAPIAWSLDHLKIIHYKLVSLLRSLTPEQWERTFVHPEGDVVVTLRKNAGIYAWHSMHHFMHIKNLMTREGW